MRAPDIESPSLGELDWSIETRANSLSTLYKQAIKYAESAESWYRKERGGKRVAGRAVRAVVIVLGGIAAVIPILAELWTDRGDPTVPPAWSSVALVIAATLLAIDRFFGFSSGWRRFISSWFKLMRHRHEFEADWNLVRAGAAEPPTDQEMHARMALARKLIAAVDVELGGETDAWSKELDDELVKNEQSLKRAEG
jgi:SMODS and SLOG-associating 2TM effector domain 2